MSTMMATQNPEAHARLVDPVVLPGIGAMVVYHMRPNEMRAGKTAVPAMVMKADRDNMLLDLLLFYDHADMMMVERVPPRIGNDRGWALQDGDTAALQREIESLRSDLDDAKENIATANTALAEFKAELAEMLLGDNAKPDECLEDRLLAIKHRLDRIESAPAAPKAAAKGKRKGK